MYPVKRVIYRFLVACLLLQAGKLTAQQTLKDSSIRAMAIHQAHRQYQNFISTAAPLYSGPQYMEYYLQIQKGQPFFLGTEFRQGSIMYDHILYENIPLKYDLIQNRIVLQDATGAFRFSPSNDKIDHFTIEGHSFIKLEKNNTNASLPPEGFYEVLYTGIRFSLLKKETRTIQEDLRNWAGEATRFVVTSANYFIKEGDNYIPINKKKQVLQYAGNRKTELKQFIRKNSLDFRNDTDNAMISALSYYQSLLK